jgi:enamine deaminase RidA (YjgF/YER057c/UK114 family)
MSAHVTHLNPAGLHRHPAFSQAVVVEGNVRTIYVGGQNAVSEDGQVVGVGDLPAQTERVFENLRTLLAASGAALRDIVKWTIYVVQGQDIGSGFAVFQRVWGDAPPPAISVVSVAGLANPDFLVEIEAVAVTAASGTAGQDGATDTAGGRESRDG